MSTRTNPWDAFPSPLAPVDARDQRIRELEEEVRLNQQFMAEVEASPLPNARVVDISANAKLCTLLFSGGLQEVVLPNKFAKTLRAGQRVRVDPKTHGILEVVGRDIAYGYLHQVERVLDERHAVIADQGGQPRIVIYGGKAPEPGELVVLDPTGTLIIRNEGQPKPPETVRETGVSWDDIGGLEDQKRELREAIEAPVLDRELFARYGKKRVRGILLCGPPGTGKTMLAKAMATALGELHGKSSSASGFQSVKGPELLSKFVGESEGAVRRLFANARLHHKAHGYPAIIFLDEADALLGKRGASRFEGMERTMVPQFLAEMDGMDDSGATVVIATNRADSLDPAVVREGRIDLKILVTRPTRAEVPDIIAKHLRGRPLLGMTLEGASRRGAEDLFAPKHVLVMVRASRDERFTLGHVASGALCAGLVERATSLAMRREKQTGEPGGIAADDLAKAAEQLCAEQKLVDWTDDAKQLGESIGGLRTLDRMR